MAGSLFLLQGCLITHSLRDSIRDTDDFKREFDQEFPDFSWKVCPGHYAGRTTRDSVEFHHLQIKEALSGKKRILNILVPVVYRGEYEDPHPLLYETDQPVNADSSALFLLQKGYSDLASNLFIWTFPDNTSPENYIQYVDPKFQLSGDSSKIFVSQINYYPGGFRFKYMIFDREGNQNWKNGGRGIFSINYDDPDNYMPDVKWQNRSRVWSILKRAGYIITVPLDIITSPIQAVIILMGQPI